MEKQKETERPGINPKLLDLIIKLQDINKHGLSNPEADKRIIKIGEKIKNKRLVEFSGDKDFAKQLLLKNNVPSKYWK